MKKRSSKRKVDVVQMRGGVIQNTSQLFMDPGALVDCRNYHITRSRGYQRIPGYERYNGRPEPSQSKFYVLYFENGSTEVTTGDIVDGASSGAQAEALVDAILTAGTYVGGDAEGYLILGLGVGNYSAGEDLEVSASKVAEAVGTQQLEGIADPNKTYAIAAIETARADIDEVGDADGCTGSVLGVCWYNNALYAFRNNSGSTEAKMYKSSATGWVLQDLGETLNFTVGETTPVEDETVTGTSSGATATIKRIIKSSGDWGHTDLVDNGDFATDTIWTKGANWTIASGVASHSAGSTEVLEQTITGLTANATYHVTFTVSNRTAGNITPKVGGTSGTARSTNDTFTEEIVAGSNGTIQFVPDTSFDGDLDDVELLLHGDAVGRLILYSVSGGPFNASEEITAPSGFVAQTNGANAANALQPGGSFEFAIHNFYAGNYTKRMYGCDGVSKAFEWDGSVFVPIITGMTTDTPTHICAHKDYLFLAFPGSAQHSDLGLPYSWTGLLGAAEIGMPDTITGFISMPGNVLAIFCRNITKLLYGTGVSGDWDLRDLGDEGGAIPDSIIKVGQVPYYMDDIGMKSLITTERYGDFLSGVVSDAVNDLMVTKRNDITCSLVSKVNGQYRLFYDDGLAVYVTFGEEQKIRGFMIQELEDVPLCSCSGEDSTGEEVMFFGASDGFVYRLDRGTSFDGDEVVAYLSFPFSHQNAVDYNKRYHKLTVEANVGIDPDTNLMIKVEYSDADAAVPAADTVELDISAAAVSGIWDIGIWDSATWDSGFASKPYVPLDGVGSNARFVISCTATYEEIHTLFAYILHYSIRGLLR